MQVNLFVRVELTHLKRQNYFVKIEISQTVKYDLKLQYAALDIST